eukprot:scaffold3532_cov215-Prasinococcus_capsulatus_cf.AAC.1
MLSRAAARRGRARASRRRRWRVPPPDAAKREALHVWAHAPCFPEGLCSLQRQRGQIQAPARGGSGRTAPRRRRADASLAAGRRACACGGACARACWRTQDHAPGIRAGTSARTRSHCDPRAAPVGPCFGATAAAAACAIA